MNRRASIGADETGPPQADPVLKLRGCGLQLLFLDREDAARYNLLLTREPCRRRNNTAACTAEPTPCDRGKGTDHVRSPAGAVERCEAAAAEVG
jgi:hypothetical protein